MVAFLTPIEVGAKVTVIVPVAPAAIDVVVGETLNWEASTPEIVIPEIFNTTLPELLITKFWETVVGFAGLPLAFPIKVLSVVLIVVFPSGMLTAFPVTAISGLLPVPCMLKSKFGEILLLLFSIRTIAFRIPNVVGAKVTSKVTVAPAAIILGGGVVIVKSNGFAPTIVTDVISNCNPPKFWILKDFVCVFPIVCWANRVLSVPIGILVTGEISGKVPIFPSTFIKGTGGVTSPSKSAVLVTAFVEVATKSVSVGNSYWPCDKPAFNRTYTGVEATICVVRFLFNVIVADGEEKAIFVDNSQLAFGTLITMLSVKLVPETFKVW